MRRDPPAAGGSGRSSGGSAASFGGYGRHGPGEGARFEEVLLDEEREIHQIFHPRGRPLVGVDPRVGVQLLGGVARQVDAAHGERLAPEHGT